MADLNTISSSKYDIYGKLLNIAGSHNYLGTSEELENADYLKTGVMGYVTESLAMIMRDSAFHKTMVYRENYLNTAIMPSSVYNYAKMFNVDCMDAKPSVRYATFTIDVNTIDNIITNTRGSVSSYQTKYGIPESSNFMVIDKSNAIIAGQYYFMLEHSIEIYKSNSGKYIVKYCIGEKDQTTSFGTYTSNGIINTSYTVSGPTRYLVFKALVAQYKATEYSKIISGTSFTETRVHQFTYSGQICGMKLKYIKGNDEEEVTLKFSNITLNEDKSSSTKVAYYSLVDEGVVEVKFTSNSTAGLPQAGGQLTMTMFLTEGFSGNISYSGDVVFQCKQDDLKSQSITVSLGSIVSSGLDQSSLSELKNTIINQLTTRNCIITEADLNTWFATQTKLIEGIGNSDITFKKDVDNILKRSFSAYLLLRDGVALQDKLANNGGMSVATSSYLSSVVPTNTIDIYVTKPTITDSSPSTATIIQPSTVINYDSSTKTFTADSTISSSAYTYNCPFTILFDTSNDQATYIYTETNDSSELELESVTAMTNLTLIPTTVEVKSVNSTSSDGGNGSYTVSFYVSSDKDLTQKTIGSAASIMFGTTKITGLSDSNNITRVDSTDDEEENGSLSNYKITYTFSIDSIGYSESGRVVVNIKKDSSSSIVISSENEISLTFKFNDNSFDGTLSSTKALTFYSSLDDVMQSDIIENKDTSASTVGYTICAVPVVANYWMTSNVNKEWFITQMLLFIKMLKANINKLETSTFFNIKFRNTYGFSHYFNTTTTQLRLTLNIYIDRDQAIAAGSSLSLTTEQSILDSLESEVRDFIRVAVDKANDNGELNISKIIMQTQAYYYKFIKHIDFMGLNGTYNQFVKTIDASDNSYPLEYFNLDETLTTSGTITQCNLTDDIRFIVE